MSPAPTTDRRPTAPAQDSPLPAIEAGGDEHDAVLGVYTLFVVIPRAEVVYFRLVVESWEDFAVPRTVQRFYEGDPGRGIPADPRRSLVVVLAVPDFVGPCVHHLARLCRETGGVQVPSTPALRATLRRDLLDLEPA